MSFLIFMICVSVIVYLTIGLATVSAYANTYTLINSEEPPTWKLILVTLAWPVGLVRLIHYNFMNGGRNDI